MSKAKDIKAEKELIFIHHGIVDSTIRIVANLFLLDQIDKNGRKVFIHNNIAIELNAELISQALDMNIKKLIIDTHGEREGLNKAYILFKSMYQEVNDEPIELTKYGHEMLEMIFIEVINNCEAAANSPTQTRTLH